MSKIRVGVIGTGAMGTSHVRTLSRWVSQAQVVTAYDADVARAIQEYLRVRATNAGRGFSRNKIYLLFLITHPRNFRSVARPSSQG